VELNFAALDPPALSSQPWLGRAFTRFATALDSGVLRAMQLAVDSLVMPSPEALPGLRDSAGPMLDEELQRRPARFFAFEEDPPRPLEARSRFRRSLDGGAAVSRELRFAYRDYAAGGAPGPVREDRVLFEHWMHGPQRPAGSVVALHGFSMGRPRIDAVALLAAHWFRLGLDVALVTLPFHGARTPQGARFSGEPFAVPHVTRMAEAVRQAVFEIRMVTSWLRTESEAPVGLLGLSLGGYLAALSAGLYADLDFVIPMAPPVCIGDLAWRFFTRSRHYASGRAPAFSRPELRAAYRIHSPLAHPPRVPRERLFIVAGRGDRIVPPEHPGSLWRHWGEPGIHWFDGGHLSPFGRRRIVARVREHLESLDIL
jgi:surfactin synthase thioesterase subunit